MAIKYDKEYVPPTLVVDSVILQIIDSELNVLLIQRTDEPFKGNWALPGGYNPAGETTKDAMTRIVRAKTGVNIANLRYIEQLYTFDTVARDPRGHAVSITYMGLGKDLEAKPGKHSQNPKFFSIQDLPQLAYDHKNIINYAHERLQAKITYTNAVFALLDRSFTLSQLQSTYEAILCRPLDKHNFRKKFLSLDLIKQTNEMHQDGAHRPARLYEFNSQKLEILTRSFD